MLFSRTECFLSSGLREVCLLTLVLVTCCVC